MLRGINVLVGLIFKISKSFHQVKLKYDLDIVTQRREEQTDPNLCKVFIRAGITYLAKYKLKTITANSQLQQFKLFICSL